MSVLLSVALTIHDSLLSHAKSAVRLIQLFLKVTEPSEVLSFCLIIIHRERKKEVGGTSGGEV